MRRRLRRQDALHEACPRQHDSAGDDAGEGIEGEWCQRAGQAPECVGEALDPMMERRDAVAQDTAADEDIAAVPAIDRPRITAGAAFRMPAPSPRCRCAKTPPPVCRLR